MTSEGRGLRSAVETVIYAVEGKPAELPLIVLSLGDIVPASQAAVQDEHLFERLYERWEKVYRECNAAARGYNLVVLSVEDSGSSGMPSRINRLGWLMWRLRSVKYDYRKNVKKIVCHPYDPPGPPHIIDDAVQYIVYPSWLTRVFMPLFLPLISSKAYAKIQYTRSLRSLYRVHGVSLAGVQLSIPLLHVEVKALQQADEGGRRGPRSPTLTGGVTSFFGKAWRAVPFLPRWDDETESSRLLDRDNRARLGDLEDFVPSEPTPIPRILTELRQAVLTDPCNRTEGIFRRSSHSPLSRVLSTLLALPDENRPVIPWQQIALDDPLLPPAKLQGILNDFSSPIISTQLYPAIRQTTTTSDLQTRIFPLLSGSEHRILAFLAQLIVDLLPFEPTTRMSPKALGICFAPALIAGPDPVQDAAMCLAPGQKLPAAMTQDHDLLDGDGTVVGMLMLWAEYTQKGG